MSLPNFDLCERSGPIGDLCLSGEKALLLAVLLRAARDGDAEFLRDPNVGGWLALAGWGDGFFLSELIEYTKEQVNEKHETANHH